jgi:hypothetical protein
MYPYMYWPTGIFFCYIDCMLEGWMKSMLKRMFGIHSI